jgi:hypothetical protein
LAERLYINRKRYVTVKQIYVKLYGGSSEYAVYKNGRERAGVNMGIFDNILGKKEAIEALTVEPADGGFTIKPLKKTEASKISRMEIMFNSATPPYTENELIKDVISEAGLSNLLLPGVLITTSYEVIPGVKEFLGTNEMPEDLNAFVMARAMMKGIARGPIEMGKIQVNSFQIKDTMGVIILKEA